MTTRRFVIAASSLMMLGAAISSPVHAQTSKPEELVAKQGPLGDIVLGKADAKVTVIEYASLTCSHCATFHATTWPVFKERYVDSGKVRFILREFPLDRLAIAGFMIARCNGPEKYYPLTDLLFEQQKNWAFVEKPVDALFSLIKQAGFTQESAEACLKRQDLYDAVLDVKNHGAEKLGVSSTPSFFINGQLRPGALTIEEFDKILKPLLGE
jgi:protein-disulfide isomerase